MNNNNITSNTNSIVTNINIGRRSHSSKVLPNPPTLLKYQNMKFLIMDAPSESNIDLYIKEMIKNNVTDLVRVCDPSYSKELVECHGIRLHDWVFPDGEGPPDYIVQAWLSLLGTKFSQDNVNDVCIATHCVAGLGRAPVLVAIALLESGMSALDAVTFIRECRRGAINSRQLKYLEGYRPRSLNTSARSSPNSKCLLM